MALMRVYCGLAASEPVGTENANEWLTAAVVDDAGRLLDVCDFGDDAVGYAELGALLAERSGDGGSVAVATDSDEHHVTRLLAAAGRLLAFVDDETLTDYADRFADDESADEIDAGPAERHAVGLARALAAGALAASGQVPPRELMALKPVLAAHASVATGRHGTAVALREVLRELYPAALRAYPDPAEPIPLAILDALPEPGLLGTTSVGRGRDAAVANELAAAGVADATTIADAITALRVAIAETPRRTGIGRGTTTAVAETIREAVAAVRACDAAINALVSLLGEAAAPTPVLAPVPVVPARPLRAAAPEPVEATRPLQRRTRTTPAAPMPTPAPAPAARSTRTPAARPATSRPSPRPAATVNPRAATTPQQDQSVPPPPPGITPIYPTQAPRGRATAKMPPAVPAEPVRAPSQPQQPAYQIPAQPAPAPHPPTQRQPLQQPAAQRSAARHVSAPPAQYPAAPSAQMSEPAAQVSGPAAPAPTSPPSAWTDEPPIRTGAPPAWTNEPAAGYTPVTYRTADQREAPAWHEPQPYEPSAYAELYDPSFEPPAYPMAPDVPAPGSRANWPLNPPSYDDEAVRARPAAGYEPAEAAIPRQRDGRVAPPWQSAEIPMPVEPVPAPPALRLVGRDVNDVAPRREAEPIRMRREPEPTLPRRENVRDQRPYGGQDFDEADGDLLIFAQARSAWFEWPNETEAEVEPVRPAWADVDAGWSAAARVENPEISGQTDVGLPRRVPAANLVPGSPLPPMTDQSLRIVRDPASMAAHTTGYFRGSRRGEEVRGYAVGSRAGRDSGGGWDFSRDGWDSDRDTGYRSAAHR